MRPDARGFRQRLPLRRRARRVAASRADPVHAGGLRAAAVEHLRKLIDHMGWADERVIAALQAAEPVPQPILTIFAHVLAAEHVWQARLAGKKPELPVWPELSLAQC